MRYLDSLGQQGKVKIDQDFCFIWTHEALCVF